MTRSASLVLLPFLVACTRTVVAEAPKCAATTPTGGVSLSVDPTEVLAKVDGLDVLRGELPDGSEAELVNAENELLQRKLHVIWAATEQAIDHKLLDAEAKKRGMDADAFRAQEIDAKVAEPTEEEVKGFYEENQEAISVAYEVAAPFLKRRMKEMRAQDAEESLVERLRQSAQITYQLPVPELPRQSIELGGAPSIGPDTAPVTLVEFSDFECPYCARAHGILQKLRELYPDTLRIVFRDFPLAQHPQARGAAEAAECANEQGKFWAFHDLLFDNQNALGSEDLLRYAKTAALDEAAFQACLSSDRPKKAVRAHETDGKRYGVDGTPALFVNGVKLIGLLPLPLLRILIDQELDRSKRS